MQVGNYFLPIKIIPMSKNIIHTFILLLLYSGNIFFPDTSFAQKKEKDESVVISVSNRLVNDKDEPISNATITVGEGVLQTKTDANGAFTLKVKESSMLLIKAHGYQTLVVKPSDITSEKIVLTTAVFLSSEDDMVRLPLGMQLTQRQLTGSVDVITGKELESYNDLVISNALQGRLMGLNVQQNAGPILGTNTPTLTVRGLSRGSSDGALVVVDGIERPMNFLIAEEIETVEVLKDATAKLLYGSRAANGVIFVTTKRGKANTKQLRVSTDYGVNTATQRPEYLNSADYVTLYNEARANDGLSPFYSPSTIEGYKNSTGENDRLYPNVDFYNYFINKTSSYRKATLQYIGGNDDSKYAFVAGYMGSNGFEKVGDKATNNQINLRGNLDFQVTPMLRAFVDANAVILVNKWAGASQPEIFSSMSSHRPNEYPLVMADLIAKTNLGEIALPSFGGSYLRPNNLYADMLYGGQTEQNYFFGQTNIGLDLKLDDYIKGLSIRSVASFDSYQYFQNGEIESAITFARNYGKTTTGADTILSLTPLRARQIMTNTVRLDEGITRNIGLTSTLAYDKTFGDHALQTSLTHFIFRNENRDNVQDVENTNTVLRLHYGFKNKLYVDASMAYMGSNKFPKANRYKLFPAVGAAWVLSEEGFLKNNSTINFLKLKGSFGILGYDRSTEFYIFANRWRDNGSVSFNQQNQTSQLRTTLDLIGNPNLAWEKSREINVGIEGYALKNALQVEVNYFNTLRYDIITNPSSLYSALAGGLAPRGNLGETLNQGVEGRVYWEKPIGDFTIGIGGNVLYAKNKILVSNIINDPLNPHLNQIGQPSDVIFGLTSNGLFTSEGEAGAAPLQTFGSYGQGDIRYQDINNDGLIDGRDQSVIGNAYPRTTLGIELNVQYKRWALFFLGTSQLGIDAVLLNNFYRPTGENKYSILANERYHPVNNPNGTYPLLTTTAGINNAFTSTFWTKDASFFRAKNIELSYSVQNMDSILKNYRFYIRGTNLFVLSKLKYSDPEAISAGISSSPILRTITGGVSVSF